MFARICAEPLRLKAASVATVLLFGILGAGGARAADGLGPSLGTVKMTLSTYPGAPTSPNGGGPFELTLSGPTTPTNLLASLGIPSSVQAWCVEISEEITPGVLNSSVQLLRQGISEVGGMVSEGLQWLKVVPSSGTAGGVQFTAAGAVVSQFAGWSAGQVGAAIQEVIWTLQGLQALPSTITGHNSTQTAALETWLQTYALGHETAYYRLHKDGLQDQVFAVPGPIIGAGLPGLLVACGGLLALARRRRKMVLG